MSSHWVLVVEVVLMKFFNKVKRFLRRHWLVISILAILLIGGGFWFWKSQQPAPVTYTLENPKRQDIAYVIEASGAVQAREVARLRFLGGGRVVFIGAQQGDWVKRGQTLATIDRSSIQKQLERELNTYEMDRYDFEQTNDDLGLIEKIEEERTAKKNQLGLENSVLAVEIQNIAFRDTYVSAPFAGVLTSSPTNVAGVQLSPSDYFEVVNPASIYFTVAVDESDIGKVKVGQSATIELDAFTDESIETTVERIGYRAIEGGSGTQFLVDLSLPEGWQNRVLLGMNGDVDILLDRAENALTIPLLATKLRDGKTFVDVKNGETIEEREITAGIESEEFVQVLSGLDESDNVVIPE